MDPMNLMQMRVLDIIFLFYLLLMMMMIKLKISFAPNGKNKENDELFSSFSVLIFSLSKIPSFLPVFFFKDQKQDVRT